MCYERNSGIFSFTVELNPFMVVIQGRQDYKEQITKNAVEFEPVEL